MQIVIVKAGAEVNKGKYKEFDLAYKKDGKIEGKKFLSFKYPEVYNALLNSKEGDEFDVSTEKVDNFWQWTKLSASQGGVEAPVQQAVPAARSSVGRVVGSTYETPEERAKKQKYIVRQSSLTTALDFLKHNNPKTPITTDVWYALADELEARVFTGGAVASISEMKDDVPY